MGNIALFGSYIFWHYTFAISDFFRIWMNFFWFVFNYFSIGLLFRTLFSPWRRMTEKKSRGFNLAEWGEVLFVNAMMRIVGFLMRSILIVVGLVALFIVFVFGLIAFFLWLFAPIAVIILFFWGIKFLLK